MSIPKKFVLGLVAALTLLAYGSVAWACSCQRVAPEDAYAERDLVFWGEVASVADGEAVLKVKRSFKGTRKNREVKFAQNNALCGFEFQEGTSYMVYADRDTRDKETKRYEVDLCSGTVQLDHNPVYGPALTLADRPQWGLTKRQQRRVQRARTRLTDKATRELRSALRSCEKDMWRGDDKARGEVEVRFDHQEKRLFGATVLSYESTLSDDVTDLKKCVEDELREVKFPKFPGGPVSIKAYRLVDRVDSALKREKGTAEVVASAQ